MIIKFFSDKKGGGVGSINYLLDNRVNKGTAKILQGDENLTRDLINSMKQKHKTCVGCLSFEEENINEDLKFELMADFERMLLTDEMQGRYNILWVEHTDKGRLELNFVIPKIDLESKTAFNPYFHQADMKRKDIWTDFVNLKHNFTNPKDPSKEQSIQGSKKEYELIKDYEELDNILQEQVKHGFLSSRAEIIELLQANKIEVGRQGKDYISVKLPDSKRAKRLKGGIYDEQFTSTKELKSIDNRQSQREREYHQRDDTEELKRLEQELNKLIQHKSKFYHVRHEKRAKQQSKRTDQVQNINDDNKLFIRDNAINNSGNNSMVSLDKSLSNSDILGDSPQRRQAKYLDSNTNRTDTRLSEEQKNKSNSNQIRDEHDTARTRIKRRSGEVINRARECSGVARSITEKRTNSYFREGQFIDNLREFRKRISEEFGKLRSRISEEIKKLNQTHKKSIESQEVQKSKNIYMQR